MPNEDRDPFAYEKTEGLLLGGDPWQAATEIALFDHNPNDNVTFVGVDTETPPVNNMAGRVILGRFAIEDFLGHGATSRVFRGVDMEEGHPVALKILQPPRDGIRQDNMRLRFEREVRFLQKMRHPSVVELVASGETERGEPVMVTELLEGRTLRVHIDRDGPMPVERALYIGKQIAESAQMIHGQGAVHRDLKPANIFLQHGSKKQDVIKLLDFGLVKSTEYEDPNEIGITRSGSIVGTPAYMSPEQALGGTIDPRSDIYTLGVLLFEMLTGRPPFLGGNLHEVLDQQIKLPVPPLASVHPGVNCPAIMEQLVRSCAQKDRDVRPQTMSEVLDLMSAIEKSLGLTPKKSDSVEESEAPTADLVDPEQMANWPPPTLETSDVKPI